MDIGCGILNYVHGKYDGVCNFLQKDTVGSKLVIYGVSSGMLLMAYKKRRQNYLVRQYKKPSHIPDKILYDSVPLTGIIRDIQPRDQDTMQILINYRPWFPLFSSRQRSLPVKLPGVQVNGNGYAWLQTCLIGREATFIPMHKNYDSVKRQLCLLHPAKGAKGRLLDISEILLKLRFAKYNPDAVVGSNKYYKHLKSVESSTNTRESLLAWTAKRPWLWKAWHELKAAILPKQRLLPELVR